MLTGRNKPGNLKMVILSDKIWEGFLKIRIAVADDVSIDLLGNAGFEIYKIV